MKKVLFSMAILLLTAGMMAACSDKEETATFAGEMDGTEVEVTLTHTGDKVIKQKEIGTTYYDDFGITKDEAKEIIEAQMESFEDVDGVEIDHEFKDDNMVESLVIDLEEIDFDDFKSLFPEAEVDDEDDHISFKETKKNILDEGLEEK